MEKKRLPSVSAQAEGLGRPTIMDRALAARHGVDYVHMVVFAIDIDRIREAVEGYDARPFAWEVFLTEAYVLARFDPNRRPEQVLLFEDVIISVLEGEANALGAQIVFSIWDAIQRYRFPVRLSAAFATWERRPQELVKDLAPLWEREAELASALAASCLEVELTPPIAEPSAEALRAMV